MNAGGQHEAPADAGRQAPDREAPDREAPDRRRTDQQSEFRFDGGATWQNLLGTRGQSFGPHPIERLGTVERLAAWLAHCELSPDLAPAEADLAKTLSLRDALSALALAVVDGRPPEPSVVARVVEFAAADPGPVRVALVQSVGGGEPALRRAAPADTTEALGRIARQALEQLTGPERHQLVSCAEHDCRWVFVDPTGRRRWCPSPSCASRGRVRALRARRRTDADRP
ncbi:MAG TPA: CGNR zinc finger domain-containing protein [Pseudonocardia sp.]|nr:CGNR zinc finger domain-containing protein [Pseudonocardia sp.]